MDFIKALMGTSPASQDTIYKAIIEKNSRLLKLYLGTTDLYIETQTIEGETILCLSIKRQRWKDFKNRLFRNFRIVEKITPLRLVISSNVIDIAVELVNINACVNRQENQLQNENAFTNTHYSVDCALQDEFFEAVCMLLYYGADVYITTSHNITPFRYAVHEKCDNLAKLLIDYYDETYYSEGPVENDFNTRMCLNYECEGAALLLDSVDNPNPEIFKLIWDRIHPLELLTSEELNFLLLTYLSSSKFPKPDWLECLGLILEHFSNRQFNCEYKEVFFENLFVAFCRKNINAEDRLDIINTCLSLGASVTRYDLEYAYQLYGFGLELEVLIYGTNFHENVCKLCTVTTFILAEEKGLSKVLITGLFEDYLQQIQFGLPADNFVNFLGYFSLSAEVKGDIKKSLTRCSKSVQRQVLEKLETVPEFPTLFELARNEARRYIKRVHKIKYPYQFHDTVKKLNFPKVVQDVILFKAALY